MDIAEDNALFLVEVPDLTLMVKKLRYDQFFHYHLHYFSEISMHHFIQNVGGQYIAHKFNYQNWGGALLFAFSKGKTISAKENHNKVNQELILKNYQIFQHRLDSFMCLVNQLDCEIVGYGAGQMLPSLAYHLNSDLGFMSTIFDDNQSREDFTYPRLIPQIKHFNDEAFLNNKAVVITALDGIRSILKSLQNQTPRHILTPINIF